MDNEGIKKIFDKLDIHSLEKRKGYIHCPFASSYKRGDSPRTSIKDCWDCRALYNIEAVSHCPCWFIKPNIVKKTFWDYVSIYKTLK